MTKEGDDYQVGGVDQFEDAVSSNVFQLFPSYETVAVVGIEFLFPCPKRRLRGALLKKAKRVRSRHFSFTSWGH